MEERPSGPEQRPNELETLRDTSARFRQLFEDAPLGYQSLDADGRILLVNRAWLELMGFTREEVLGRPFSDFLAPGDAELFRKRFPLFKEKGEIHGVEFEMVRKDGKTFTASFEGRISRNPDGSFRETHCVLTDITERRRAREALERSAGEWQATFDGVTVGICIIDLESVIQRCNGAMATMFGKIREEIIGSHCCEIVHGSKEPLPDCPVQKMKRSLRRETIEFRFDGRWLEVAADPILDGSGALMGAVHIVRDITKRKSAEEEKALLATMVDASPVSITVHDFEGKFIYANESTLKMHGYSREEFLALPLGELDVPQSAALIAERMREIREKGEALFEVRSRRKDKTTFPLLVYVKLVQWEGRQVLLGMATDISEKKRAEEALALRDAQLSGLVGNAGSGVAITDIEGRFTFVNGALCELTGYTEEELLGRNFADFLHPDDVGLIMDIFLRAHSLPEFVAHIEFRVVRKDGSVRHCYSAPAAQVLDGQIAAFVAIVFDITDRKKTEQALQASEERFRKMFEEGPVGMAVSDMEYRFLAANSVFCKVLGYSAEELQGLTFRDITHADDVARDAGNIRRLGSGELPVYRTEKRYIRKDGGVVWGRLTVSLLRDAAGRAGHHLVMLEDITSRKRLEDAIRESEEKYRSLVENSAEGILLTAPDGRILSANPAACRMLGRGEEEICRLGRNGFVDTEDSRLQPALDERVRTGKFRGELTLVRQDGTKFPAEVSTAVFELAGGEKRTVMMISDITERRKAEEALRAAKEHLELRVKERTRELETANRKLQEEIAERLRATDAVRAERKRFYDVLETLPAYLILLTPDHHVPFANRFFRERFGESQGRRCFEYLFNRDEPCENCKTYDTLKNMAPLEWDWTGPDGHDYHVYDFPFRDTDGATLIMEMGIDVTERKRAEEELRRHKDHFEQLVGERTADLQTRNVQLANEIAERKTADEALLESAKKYRSLFENMLEGYAYCRIIYDRKSRPVDWTYLDVNRAFSTLTGLENVVGKNVTGVFPRIKETNPELFELYGRVVRTGQPESKEVNISGLGMKAGWLNISVFSPAKGDFVAIFSDITERKKSDLALRRALMRYELEEGRLYLVMEGAPHTSYEAFSDLLKAGYDGLVVTRGTGASSELWRTLRCTVVPLLARAHKGVLAPEVEELERWAEGLPAGKAVVLDRLDYLVSRMGFKRTLQFVHRLGEIADQNRHIVILSVDPATLEAREVRLLEKEGGPVEPLSRESVPEELLDTMKHIYEKNITGVRPTLASAGRDLGLSKPTVRKRMRILVELGYVVSHSKGSGKTLELTEKGRAVFLR